MNKVIILVGLFVSLGAIVSFQPTALTANHIIDDLVSHEILGLMAVILTVTLAAVANIHLALNRLLFQKFKNSKDALVAISATKKELKDDCWYIFYGFVLASVLVLIKGSVESVPILALIHAGVLWIFGLYLMCMLDVYQVVFGVVDLETGENGPPQDISQDGGDRR